MRYSCHRATFRQRCNCRVTWWSWRGFMRIFGNKTDLIYPQQVANTHRISRVIFQGWRRCFVTWWGKYQQSQILLKIVKKSFWTAKWASPWILWCFLSQRRCSWHTGIRPRKGRKIIPWKKIQSIVFCTVTRKWLDTFCRSGRSTWYLLLFFWDIVVFFCIFMIGDLWYRGIFLWIIFPDGSWHFRFWFRFLICWYGR